VPTIPQAGVTPASFFLPVLFTAPNGVVGILADPIDVKTGEYLSIERGFDPTDASVLTAVRTVRGSGSSVENVGQRFADHQRVDPQLDRFMREEVRLTLKSLVDAGDIEIERVEVPPLGDSAETYIEWRNIARDQARAAVLPPNLLVGRAP
jgi:hypothetical protein